MQGLLQLADGCFLKRLASSRDAQGCCRLDKLSQVYTIIVDKCTRCDAILLTYQCMAQALTVGSSAILWTLCIDSAKKCQVIKVWNVAHHSRSPHCLSPHPD